MSKVRGLRQAGVVRDADMGRKHAARSGHAASMHAHPHPGMSRQGIHKGRRRRLYLRVHIARVVAPLGFHEYQNKVGFLFPLGRKSFALQQGLRGHAVKGQMVARVTVHELPQRIAFDFLPKVLVRGAIR